MSSRPNRARAVILREMAAGLYPDASGLIDTIVSESRGPTAWRPARAAALRIQAEAEGRVWMTVEEFELWITTQTLLTRKLKRAEKPMEAVGLSPYLKITLLRGKRPVAKTEALAMAHYAAGRPLPCPVGDSEAFDAWFTPRFGAVDAVASWLGLRGEYISDRRRGYDIALGERKERLPDATLLRALDWVWTYGPWCPYGEQVTPAIFPNQDLEV